MRICNQLGLDNEKLFPDKLFSQNSQFQSTSAIEARLGRGGFYCGNSTCSTAVNLGKRNSNFLLYLIFNFSEKNFFLCGIIFQCPYSDQLVEKFKILFYDDKGLRQTIETNNTRNVSKKKYF